MSEHPLDERKRKELAQLAKHSGVAGWHGMSKAQLVTALMNFKASGAVKSSPPRRETAKSALAPAAPRRLDQPAQRNQPAKIAGARSAPLTLTPVASAPDETDRVILLARDPFWLQVYWAISRVSLQRGQAALGKEWYGARPILRLYEVTPEETAPGAELAIRDIAIHAGVRKWYIDVVSPPNTCYRVEIGFVTLKGRFLALASSNVATTLLPTEADRPDETWRRVRAEFDRRRTPAGSDADEASLVNLFEERTRRPLTWGGLTDASASPNDFPFAVEAEVVVHGACDPAARVLLQNEPITLRPDGTFSVRFGLAEGRQIVPAVAQRRDGSERTVILAIERNTKVLEPMLHDAQDF